KKVAKEFCQVLSSAVKSLHTKIFLKRKLYTLRMKNERAEALTMTRGRSMERGSSGSQNHGKSKSRRRKNLKCYNCDMRGHLKDCWHNKKNGGKNYEALTSQGCVASTLDDGVILYSEATISFKGGKQLHDGWIMDYGET
ncbi:hypothetical protein CR513_23120, partial [Mucuna pruriens]